MNRKAFLLLGLIYTLVFNTASSQVSSYTFTTATAAYTGITGTVPVLTGNGTDAVQDEGYVNGIPIGFSFYYLGANYNSIGASTNGFASFASLSSAGFSNNLSTGIAARSLLAPFWEDIALSAASGIQYLTTGSAGNRIFILQWSNVLCDFGAAAPALSFQLRLYETTNKIEFIYNQLAGMVQDFSGGASIGITGATTGTGSYLSLNNSSASPAISSVAATNNIITKPASGQVYVFTPQGCIAPGNLNATGITTTGASISWTDGSATAFEYAVTTSAIPPASGTTTSFTSAFAGGLEAGTQYYLHVRKNCSGTISGWASYPFATLCNAAAVPYAMPISSVISPALPLCTTASDDNQDGNTWRTYPSGGAGWTDQVVAYVYNYNTTTSANDWFYTAGLNLAAGTSYRLTFKYNNDATSVYTEKLQVAYGMNPAAAAMTRLLADYSSVYSSAPKTISIDFVPAVSGTYYIGFHASSDANKDVLILDDISVKATPLCDAPVNLSAKVGSGGVSVNVSWQKPGVGIPSGYEYAVTTSNSPPVSGITSVEPSGFVASLVANTRYYLHVRTNCSGAFSDWATLAFATVANDEPCAAIPLIAGAAPLCGNTTLATSVNDPYSYCSDPNNSVWYKYTATVTGTVVLKMTTPASSPDPLHGWAMWYLPTNECPNIAFYEISECQQFGNDGSNDTDYLISPVLTAGNTYYIMIDGFSNDAGEFCISIPSCSPAINVKIEDIISTSAKVNWSGTGSFIIEYGPAGFTPGTGAVAGAGGTIINSSSSSQVLQGLIISTTYDVYIRQNCSEAASGYSINSTVTSFTTLGPPPSNDNCSGAIHLTVFDEVCSGGTAGSTLNATRSDATALPECTNNNVGNDDDDVWYSFTPVAGQQFVNINFIYTGGNSDIEAQVFTSSDNSCSGVFTSYECSDDEGDGNMPGFFSLPVIAGKTYFVRVFTHSRGVNGQFSICITRALLINDNASGAIQLVVDAPCPEARFTNVGATYTSDEPTGLCSSTTGYATVWYWFVAPASGAVRISTATGSGNTLTNTRVALFASGDVYNYAAFQLISCDEDGGSGAFDNMSVLYATGLTEGWTYYIQVDKYDNLTSAGTFGITVERLITEMLSVDNDCKSVYQVPVGAIGSYTGWVSLMDASSKLVALVRNINGGAANAYSVMQNINSGSVRQDLVSGEYYLNRSFKITNTTTGTASINVQLFYLNSELAALRAFDSAAIFNHLRVTMQAGTDCLPDFIPGSGSNTEISQLGSGSDNEVNWIKFNTTSFSNFYIHSTKSLLTAKTFLQGAYSTGLGRHKDVTPAWANVLNTYTLRQPYNTTAFGSYAGTESVSPGFFTSTPGNTDIVDWILIETKTSAGSLVARRAAFIREDGMIVDLDGVSPVAMYGQGFGINNIFIRHRNHLSIRTGLQQLLTPVLLGNSRPLLSYDFTTGQNRAYQNTAITSNAAMSQSNGVYIMWGGNANTDGYVRVTTLGLPVIPSDAAYILGSILGGNPNFTYSGYSNGDINMDGHARSISQALPPIPSDVSFILGTILGGDPNATRREHK